MHSEDGLHSCVVERHALLKEFTEACFGDVAVEKPEEVLSREEQDEGVVAQTGHCRLMGLGLLGHVLETDDLEGADD